jgi:multidrug efflux pump subunit AcrB
MLQQTGAAVLLVPAAATLLVCGCSRGVLRTLHVGMTHPGASPQEVADTLAEPIAVKLLDVPHVQWITAVSSAGRLDMYVDIAPGGDTQTVLRDVVTVLDAMEQIPAAAMPPSVVLMPSGAAVPAVRSSQIDCVVVDLQQKALAAHGISARDVVAAIQEQAPGDPWNTDRAAELVAVSVADPDGRVIPLTELAEIRIERQPNHIFRRWK